MFKFARLFVIGVLLAGMFAALPRGAFACSCMMPPGPQESLQGSDAVFAGEVVSIVDRNAGQVVQSSGDPILTTFQVNTVWKGDPMPAIAVSTARDSATCGYNFERGREYIVYVSVFEGQLGTNICTRTALLADAQGDVAALGEGQTVAQPSPEQPVFAPWLLGALLLAGVVAIAVFVFGLVRVRSKSE